MLFNAIVYVRLHTVGRDNVIGIETRSGLNGCKIPMKVPHPSTPALGPTMPPIQRLPGDFRESCGRGVALTTHPPPPSSSEVTETVQLYLYSPSGPSRPVPGRIFLYFSTSKRSACSMRVHAALHALHKKWYSAHKIMVACVAYSSSTSSTPPGRNSYRQHLGKCWKIRRHHSL
jgi:hypothetical protein